MKYPKFKKWKSESLRRLQKAIFIFFIVVVQLFDDVPPSFPGTGVMRQMWQNISSPSLTIVPHYHTSLTIIPHYHTSLSNLTIIPHLLTRLFIDTATKFARKELIILKFRIPYINAMMLSKQYDPQDIFCDRQPLLKSQADWESQGIGVISSEVLWCGDNLWK